MWVSWLLVEFGRNCAPRRGACVHATLGTSVSDIPVGERWRGRVRLGGHDPRERRERRVRLDVGERAPGFLGHV
jgi:hypothetical protein